MERGTPRAAGTRLYEREGRHAALRAHHRDSLRAPWTGGVSAAPLADVANLRFYKPLGFRLLRVERDAFTPSAGYPAAVTIDGIPLRDRVWLTLPPRHP